jgi:hypothetical protein
MIKAHDILIAYVGGHEFLAGEQIRPVPLSKTWLQRTGKYQCVNRGNDAVIKVTELSKQTTLHLGVGHDEFAGMKIQPLHHCQPDI